MNRRTFLKVAFGVGCAACLVGCYSIFVERYLVRFPHYRIPVPHLPEVFAGLKIAHITDIHYGFLISRDFIKDLVREVNNLEKDIVVCTGDFAHNRNNTEEVDTVWSLLSELRARLGVYSVLGNHDHWAGTNRSLNWLEESGQSLRGKAAPIEKNSKRIWVGGVGDLLEDPMDIDTILGGIPDQDCRIVLAHNPDSADTPFRGRIDLMIAGHTHGGQVNVPFCGPPVLPVKNKTYSCGLKKSQRNHSVFISRGIGCTMFPIRLNAYPEVPILELVPA